MTTSLPLDSADAVLGWFDERFPSSAEYRQAAARVIHHVIDDVRGSRELCQARVLERLLEPERVVSFRISWESDAGEVNINRGYRVQHNGALGPYKGGLRFVEGLRLDTLRFLAFDQTFKNSLTGLNLGSAKGGADFSTAGRSRREIERFCQAFMLELHRHIGEDTDVPAGDIGVGSREIGYLFGRYRRLENQYVPTLSGKALAYGGSELRREATGWGAIYFLCSLLGERSQELAGLRICVSGAGNVAIHVAQKATELGAKVLTLSGRDGYLLAEDGLTGDQICQVQDGKANGRDLADIAQDLGCSWQADAKPWVEPCDIAIPSATQNELEEADADALLEAKCELVVEAANMPLTDAATAKLQGAGVVIAPGQAANAGGVATSALEMQQNRLGVTWSAERVDDTLKSLMKGIYDRVREHSSQDDGTDLQRAADRAGFARVGSAMLAQGRY